MQTAAALQPETPVARLRVLRYTFGLRADAVAQALDVNHATVLLWEELPTISPGPEEARKLEDLLEDLAGADDVARRLEELATDPRPRRALQEWADRQTANPEQLRREIRTWLARLLADNDENDDQLRLCIGGWRQSGPCPDEVRARIALAIEDKMGAVADRLHIMAGDAEYLRPVARRLASDRRPRTSASTAAPMPAEPIEAGASRMLTIGEWFEAMAPASPPATIVRIHPRGQTDPSDRYGRRAEIRELHADILTADEDVDEHVELIRFPITDQGWRQLSACPAEVRQRAAALLDSHLERLAGDLRGTAADVRRAVEMMTQSLRGS